MCERQVELGGHQCPGRSRVGISVEDHPIRLFFHQHRLQPLHHFAGLNTMACRAHAEVVVRRGHSQFAKKDVAHGRVVMLSGMNDLVLHAVAKFGRGVPDRGSFYELWSGSDERNNPHKSRDGKSASSTTQQDPILKRYAWNEMRPRARTRSRDGTISL